MENKINVIDILRFALGLVFMGCVLAVTLFLVIDGNEGQMSNFFKTNLPKNQYSEPMLVGFTNLNPIFWLGVLIVSCWLLFCNEKLK